MEHAIPLALAGSLCTAASSVCQRLGARAGGGEPTRVDLRLVFRLARRPIWLVGLASQILGFAFQVTALRYGALALVQPVFALELLLVFAAMSVLGPGRVTRRDLLAAGALSAGLGLLLLAAAPSGGRPHAPASLWWLAGLIIAAAVLAGLAAAFRLRDRTPSAARRRAAVLGAVTGIAWGFVAAVIKEFGSRLGEGLGPVLGNWSLYVLIGAGAASLLLASHARVAGPLAASQPGFTILDPLTAGLLGLFLFGEHIQTGPASLAAEALALALLAGGVLALSHSRLLAADDGRPSVAPTRRGLGADAATAAEQRGRQSQAGSVRDDDLDLDRSRSRRRGRRSGLRSGDPAGRIGPGPKAPSRRQADGDSACGSAPWRQTRTATRRSRSSPMSSGGRPTTGSPRSGCPTSSGSTR